MKSDGGVRVCLRLASRRLRGSHSAIDSPQASQTSQIGVQWAQMQYYDFAYGNYVSHSLVSCDVATHVAADWDGKFDPAPKVLSADSSISKSR